MLGPATWLWIAAADCAARPKIPPKIDAASGKLLAYNQLVKHDFHDAFDATTGAVFWRLATGQSMGGDIVSYLGHGTQRIGVAAGMKSPIWPGGSAASQIVVYGLR